MAEIRDVVLVHGLWHQPAHFELLKAALTELGIAVTVPALHRGSLAEDTSAVQRVVDESRIAPVVVGHSYGGAVITGLTGIHHLVYVAAFVPDTGESSVALGGRDSLINDAVTVRLDRSTEIVASKARDCLYADCSELEANRAIDLLVSQAPGHGRGVPQHIAWRDTASTYVVCEQDRALDPNLQRHMSRHCTNVVSMAASHSPFLSRPAELAELIAAIARS